MRAFHGGWFGVASTIAEATISARVSFSMHRDENMADFAAYATRFIDDNIYFEEELSDFARDDFIYRTCTCSA